MVSCDCDFSLKYKTEESQLRKAWNVSENLESLFRKNWYYLKHFQSKKLWSEGKKSLLTDVCLKKSFPRKIVETRTEKSNITNLLEKTRYLCDDIDTHKLQEKNSLSQERPQRWNCLANTEPSLWKFLRQTVASEQELPPLYHPSFSREHYLYRFFNTIIEIMPQKVGKKLSFLSMCPQKHVYINLTIILLYFDTFSS